MIIARSGNFQMSTYDNDFDYKVQVLSTQVLHLKALQKL